MDLYAHVRKLWIFAILADHRNFHRAATATAQVRPILTSIAELSDRELDGQPVAEDRVGIYRTRHHAAASWRRSREVTLGTLAAPLAFRFESEPHAEG